MTGFPIFHEKLSPAVDPADPHFTFYLNFFHKTRKYFHKLWKEIMHREYDDKANVNWIQ